MSSLRIRLFGKFQAELEGRALSGLDAFKVQELFCYLLLNRDRPHHRESLSGLLWGDNQTAQSKKYLRQALWQLQLALNTGNRKSQTGLLVVDSDWVRITAEKDFWLDIQVFDETMARVRAVPGQLLESAQARALEEAVRLYTGDLLDGWYQDWCLFERERLQNVYFDMLDKLMAYCEIHQQYEAGLEYGAKILHYDRARERTHWQLMRLYYLANDRAGALRQFQRCATALEQELGVKPSQRTLTLYEQLRADHVPDLLSTTTVSSPSTHPTPFPHLLERLKSLRLTLSDLQRQVDQELRALEDAAGD